MLSESIQSLRSTIINFFGYTGYSALPGLCLLLGYRNYYAIHGSPYTSVHVLIENTLVQHKMAKNSRMALLPELRV